MDIYKHIKQDEIMKAKRLDPDLEIHYVWQNDLEEYGFKKLDTKPRWNWDDLYYIIGLKSKCGLYIHEFLEKFERSTVLYKYKETLYTLDGFIESFMNNPKIIKHYSTKKQPEYRAYENFEEAKVCFGETVMLKGRCSLFKIVGVTDASVEIGADHCEFDEIFKDLKFQDGTPLGVKI